MLEQIVLIVHVLVAVAILALIMLQQGKGADMGASFGSGASQTVFGVQGGGNLLTRWTAVLATVFFATSLTLAYFARIKSGVDYEVDMPTTVPAIVEEVDVNDEVPALPVQSESHSDEIPALEPAAEVDEMNKSASDADNADEEISQPEKPLSSDKAESE